MVWSGYFMDPIQRREQGHGRLGLLGLLTGIKHGNFYGEGH